MTLSIRARLLLVSLSLVAATAAVGYALVEARLTGWLEHFVRDQTTASAELAAFEAERFTASSPDDWEVLARELARRAGGRVTLAGPTGEVLADSELGVDSRPATLDDPRHPEIQAALRGERGERVRPASELGPIALFVAVPVWRGQQVVGVARVARSSAELQAAQRGLRVALAVAVTLVGVVALILSALISGWSSRSLRAVTGIVRKMALGDLDARTATLPPGELAELGAALHHLGRGLHQTVNELQTALDRLEGTLAGMEEGVLVLDGQKRVALVNPSLRELLMLSGDPTGKSPHDVIRHVELEKILDAALREGPVAREIELGELQPRRLRVRAAPSATEPGGVFAVFTDVTEMRRLETVRRDFVANVSHELRTPVTAIRSAAETLSGALKRDPDAAETFVDIIDRNAERLHGLVEDLLDLSRIESRELRPAFEPVDLGEVFSLVLGLFHEQAAKRNVTLRNALVGHLPAARADRRALENVLTNLVDNAVKYGGADTEVCLDATTDQSQVLISVTDNGSGISAEHLPRIFERFYRVDTGRSRSLGGTGLGLSIVKHLVEAMAGEVSVTSKLGEGTRFQLTLPRADRD